MYYLVHHKVRNESGRLSCRMTKGKLEHITVYDDDKYNALFMSNNKNVLSSQFYYVFKTPAEATEFMKQAITHEPSKQTKQSAY